MAFRVAGDYFESCSCDVSCNCIFLGLATQDHCDVVIGWHVTDGQQDDVDLRGLNAAMVIRSPKRMLDGNWQVALYLDDRANQAQSQALGAIFSGQAGGHLAALGPLIGKVEGVTPAAITFRDSERQAPARRRQRNRGRDLRAARWRREDSARYQQRAVRSAAAARPSGAFGTRALQRLLANRSE